jgi:uncharacterized protein
MRLWRSLAEQGNAGGQFYLGFLYEKGDGVPQSYPESLKWYRLAADQGSGAAQASIGFLYDSGHGVPQSYVEALRQAGNRGPVASQRLSDLLAVAITPSRATQDEHRNP